MGNKNQTYNKPIKKDLSRSLISGSPAGVGFQLLAVAIISILTFLCYHYSLKNDFTNWDDDRFVTDNAYIKSLSAENLKMLLFHDVKVDNYVPLTMISYAINYHFSGLDPRSYFLTNVIIHILNSCLMFFLALMTLEAMEKNGYGIIKWKEWLAFFCAMVFAVHPMHVESVSWIAERKDVLYAFFYFCAMMAYIRYTEVQTKKYRWWLLVFILFILSVLSKPMAIVFPFSLLAIDVLLKRDKTSSLKNILFEKIPFLLVSIVAAVITYVMQKSSGTITVNYVFFQRVLFSTHNFYLYIIKAFIPIPLSAFYPFPDLIGASGRLPSIFYLSPFITLAMVAIPLYVSYRTGENNFRIVLFGLGFFFFNIIMVSQIIEAGPTLMGERYGYVSYFGIFLPVTYFTYKLILKGKWIRNIVTAIISVYVILLGIRCYQRTLIWHNSGTLWTDVVNQYPQQISIAYHHLGHYYYHHGDMVKAYYNYWEAINLKIYDARAYRVMGLIMVDRKQYDSAFYCYKVAIQEDSNFYDAYIDRGLEYSQLGKYYLAIKDFRHAEKLHPGSEDALSNIAFNFLTARQYDSAISYYNGLIKSDPTMPKYFHCRGAAEFNKGEIKPALDDLLKNHYMAPHDSECTYFLSVTYYRLGDINNAYQYAQLAQNARYPLPEGYLKSLEAKVDSK